MYAIQKNKRQQKTKLSDFNINFILKSKFLSPNP